MASKKRAGRIGVIRANAGTPGLGQAFADSFKARGAAMRRNARGQRGGGSAAGGLGGGSTGGGG